MRHLVFAALTLMAVPAFAQGTVPAPALYPAPVPAAPLPATPAPATPAASASTVPCTCSPAAAPVAQAAPPVRRRRRVARYVPPTPLPPVYNYGTTTTAYAPLPFAPVAPNSQGILGYIPENTESIAFLGLGYTDGFFGAEAGAGGSGPLHAGY